ncbi:type IV secretory system conjugative DNA transfer family protein [Kordiimonas sp. SCSIO 12603]|uniref:type IV secretory system conjugative DNA transfer family protein n=1 Tax=Kordiimonas sp. SCSIO 12603 TaxID=2829596 RepID=UPI00210802DB|nr:type IV secretory system conjugative DNA transfer family protein [Kordiimonas sp. SCSIO 12603]UTW59298.1 type IV secretory system conjugative DNA transfer family protein [Kordiimonas sp. SCSIO 12603]
MKYLDDRRVQIGFVVTLLVSLLFLHGIEGDYGRSPATYIPTLSSLITGFAFGLLLAGLYTLTRFLIKRYGKWVFLIFLAGLILIGDSAGYNSAAAAVTSPIAGIIGFIWGVSVIMYFYLKAHFKFIPKTKLPNVFGSSRWATKDDLVEWDLLGEQEKSNGLFLGKTEEDSIVYDGDMHALTVAPTRTGKGATAIIPNLLRSNSSILVIDPKGENARRTVEARSKACDGRDSKVYVIDPWAISTQADKYGEGISEEYLSGYNPLASLNPNDPDLVTDVMMLADALVIDSPKDPFWTDEAKALIYGVILYVVTDEAEEGNRTLARVRDIISMRPAKENDIDLTNTINEIIINMRASDHPMVQTAADRIEQKEAKEFSGVLSSAQSNTHFLDSPVIRKSLEGNNSNSFSFADLKTADERITVYLVLPLDRLPTFHRWLRLLVTSAMIDLTRVPVDNTKPPVRVILDEFAALDKIPLIEKAYGTMAGLGVQLWVFTQDLGQLMKLYGDKAWQTFVSNAGVFQYFGSRDYETAKYAEHLCGMTTMKKRSFSFGNNHSHTSGINSSSGAQGGSSGSSSSSTTGSNESITIDDVSRPLAYADEMMTLHRNKQVLFVENRYPIIAEKHWWFEKNTKSWR